MGWYKHQVDRTLPRLAGVFCLVFFLLGTSCAPRASAPTPTATPTPTSTPTVQPPDPIQVAQDSVVMVVVSRAGREVGSGSGVIVLDRKHVLTNLHVVQPGDTYQVVLAPPKAARILTSAVVVDFDEKRDLALLYL